MGATAVMRSDTWQASTDDIWAPLDCPVLNTLVVSMHSSASSSSSSASMNTTSGLSGTGAAIQKKVPLSTRFDGDTPMKS